MMPHGRGRTGRLAFVVMATGRKSASLDGDAVLYPYLAKQLPSEDYWLAQVMTARFLVAFGIWLHPDTYARLPILLPHVVRDASARKSVGGVELWGSPDESGYLRDDNSSIKNLVRSLTIQSPNSAFVGKRVGKGWVASHIWQHRRDGDRATRHAETNSFIPNLVWLPKWLSLLSDRQGSFVQGLLQGLSAHIYRSVPVGSPRDRFAERAWTELVIPQIPGDGLPALEGLNYFAHDNDWCARRESTIGDVVGLIDGRDSRSLPSRYRVGLPSVGADAKAHLRQCLAEYLGS